MLAKQTVVTLFALCAFTVTAHAGDLPTELEMLKVIDDITVHENEHIPGEYEAPEFARDFQKACADFGIHCMRLFFGVPGRTEHVANVIEVDYEWSDVVRRFCMVEPQKNSVVACWIDDEISDELLPGMTWVQINEAYPWFPEDLQASNGDYYFYVDHDPNG